MWLVLLSSGIFWKQLAWKNRIPGFHLSSIISCWILLAFYCSVTILRELGYLMPFMRYQNTKVFWQVCSRTIINVFVYGPSQLWTSQLWPTIDSFHVYHLCNCSVVLACKSIALIQGCCRSAHLLRYSHPRPGPYRLLAREIQHTHTVRRPPRPRTRTLYSETNN